MIFASTNYLPVTVFVAFFPIFLAIWIISLILIYARLEGMEDAISDVSDIRSRQLKSDENICDLTRWRKSQEFLQKEESERELRRIATEEQSKKIKEDKRAEELKNENQMLKERLESLRKQVLCSSQKNLEHEHMSVEFVTRKYYKSEFPSGIIVHGGDINSGDFCVADVLTRKGDNKILEIGIWLYHLGWGQCIPSGNEHGITVRKAPIFGTCLSNVIVEDTFGGSFSMIYDSYKPPFLKIELCSGNKSECHKFLDDKVTKIVDYLLKLYTTIKFGA